MNFHDLDNYNLADAVKFHQRLNPRLWGRDEHLLPEVRDKLLAIAADFQEFLGVDDLNTRDITISGSNAAYSYTPHSDIDLHLVVDMPDDPVYQELFAAKKFQYNQEHDIKIAGVPVELYVQPSDQKHVSQGIYSVKNGDWTQVPQRRRASVDDSCVQHKTADLDARIHSAIKSGDADAVNQLWDKIKNMRQTGLEKNGEFGCENITFKLLRNMGCIGQLKDAKTAIQDRELSLARKPAPRKKMNYGMRDYWYPGTAYAGQDHPAGTESEQVDESADPDHLKKILHRFYASCVDKLQLKNPPRLQLETTTDWSQENGSFGQYDSDSNTLILATSGRHVLDILRTMAHEMTHRQQDERNPLPIDAGETGSPWEDQANAMAGRIMRDWAQEQPDMFDGVTLEEASGYIPTKKQARDPRFVMALTRDVRPGAVGKEANKLGLQTDSQGHPALLTAGLNRLLREFKEQDLFEINMGGKNLRKEAAKTGALAGMEFEMIVPDTSSEDQELEPDFDMDESASSASDIRDFFYDGDYNSRRSTQDMIDQIMDDYSNWQVEQFDTRWDLDAEEFIFQYIKDNIDDDDVRQMLDLEEEDPIGRQEYLLVADMIATEQMEPWYEDAKNDASDSFYEDDRFEDFLQDNNMEHMSDIYHRYDGIIHWPHYTSGGGDTSVEDVADSFSAAVGRPAQARSDYHAYGQERPGPGKNFYVVEPDGSLQPDDTNDSGLEFVSPPLPIDDIMSDLKKVKAWADKTGCYTNDSTGLHINISVPNYSQDQLDYVKLALLMGDEYVLNNFGRAGNTYAKSAMGKIKGKVTPENAKQILDKMKSGLDQLATKAIHSGYTDKYTSINTKDGHIEFRSPGGDWLDDNFDKIENTLMRFTVAMSAALNPEAYRQEYLKKLYKMLAPKGENDPLAIFAKYSAGELPKAALKSFVRQAQLERGNKAAKQAELDVMQKELTPAPEESNQGNWGIWLGAANQFSRMPGEYPAGQSDTLRRFPSQEAAEQFLAQTRASIPRMRTDAEVREIQPATAPAAMQPGQYQWQITDDNDQVVYSFVSSTAQRDANDVARNWIQSQPPSIRARGPFNVWLARLGGQVPGSTVDLQRQRQRDAASAAASMAADAAPSARQLQQMAMSNVTNPPYYPPPTPIPGVQDIDIDIPMAQTQWEVYNRSSNQPIFVMQAANQAEAWRKGQEWVAAAQQADPTVDASNFSVRPSSQPVAESITVLEQRLRQELDALGNQAPTGPESPPKMPAGTIKVDVSDMYDWYKLGQHISNLKGVDKRTLGTGPPSTVFAFGSEELENKYSHELMNLGLKTHDLDEPGEEDVDESQEITKLGKLDSVLERCISMIYRGQETNPEKYGRVAACLIDDKNNHTYAINLPGPNGTRRHAERVAIDTHLKRHGRIGSNAIMVTTLSPCVNHMAERDGESCTELLSDYGIEKCYAGWQDPTQQPATAYPFNLQVTDNADIFNTCQNIAASFLPQNMTNNLDEAINPDCFDPAFNDTQIFDGLTYRATVEEEYGKPVLTIKVLDDNFQQVGLSKFKQSKKGVVSLITSFRPEYQGQGIARNIYAYVRMLGNTIVPSKNQLPPGKAMWAAWKKSGDAKHLMKDVAEAINPDVLDPRFNHKQKIGDYTYIAGLEPDEWADEDLFVIRCYDGEKMIGQARFYTTFGDSLVSALTTVEPEYQKQGIASTMYAYARMLGNTIEPSASQLPSGKKMWKAWKKSGDAKHLMKDVAEEEEPTRIKINNNDAARAFIQRVYARYPHTMQNNHVMVWGSGDDQQFAMFELIPSFSKRGAVEVKWIQAYPLRQGVGTRAMKELQAMAREDGISLTLFPWDKGQVSQSKLTKFYRGQGFKPTVKGGKAMQWEPISERKQYPLEDFEGLKFRIVADSGQLFVNALDSTGNNELGHVTFNIDDSNGVDPQDLFIKDKFRGQGIAKIMYDFVKSKGYKIQRSWDQTDAGAGFWNKHKGDDVRVWEQKNVAEARPEHPTHEFETAYHITSTENAEEILYAGLDPYDGKAFMVVNEGDKVKLQRELSTVGNWMYAKTEGSDDPLTLLQIDVSGIPLTYEHGWYFSTTKISPDRITDLGVKELARYV